MYFAEEGIMYSRWYLMIILLDKIINFRNHENIKKFKDNIKKILTQIYYYPYLVYFKIFQLIININSKSYKTFKLNNNFNHTKPRTIIT